MKIVIVAPLVFCCSLFVSCGQQELTEAFMRKEILRWWGAKEIDAVCVEDYLQEDSVVTVLARLVVGSDTTVRMSYQFKHSRDTWELDEGPVSEELKPFCVDELSRSPMRQAREAALKTNTANLRTVLEMHCAATGNYPAHITEGDTALSPELRDYFLPGIKNPYIPEALPFIDALGDTSEWFEGYAGKVVYFPWVEVDGRVEYYLLRPSTPLGFTGPILGQWPP
jgi:hypothetical protein